VLVYVRLRLSTKIAVRVRVHGDMTSITFGMCVRLFIKVLYSVLYLVSVQSHRDVALFTMEDFLKFQLAFTAGITIALLYPPFSERFGRGGRKISVCNMI